MADAEKREKVIRGLECCISPDILVTCLDCPYGRERNYRIECIRPLLRDVLALLREQEPRVLSEEEVRYRLGTFVWAEIHSPHVDRSMCLVFGKVYEDTAYPDQVTIREDSGVAWGRWWEDYDAGCWHGIRSGWRCWTSRPSEEQRKAVPWDAEP